MIKRQISLIIILLITSIQLFSSVSKIRINNLGYLPEDSKKAVLISETSIEIKEFSIHDALTNDVQAVFKTIEPWGSFDKFNSIYILDFSSFNKEGVFYIKASGIYSPNLFINNNIYINTSNKLIDYLRSQRFGKEVSGGWWYDASNKNRSASVNASVTYQLLYTYYKYPDVFEDKYDEDGTLQSNGIPDIIDEAKWGLDWLLNINGETVDIAVAGKLVSTFALATDVVKFYYPKLEEVFRDKAIDIYKHIKNSISQNKHKSVINNDFQEENWQDDMQLAATQMYLMTFDSDYLKDALSFGAAEPLPLWLFATCDNALQFYPYVNWSPFLLGNIENPLIKKNFINNLHTALQRSVLTAKDNPFKIGINLSENSNNKITALHNIFFAYRQMTGNKDFNDYEKALFDWIFGSNPWGTSMVTKIPEYGKTPKHPHALTYLESEQVAAGALVNGAVNNYCLKGKELNEQIFEGTDEQYQTDWAVYHDNKDDNITNQPNIDGTASLLHLIAGRQATADKKRFFDLNIYEKGGIQQFNPQKMQIVLVFTGHEYNDGYNNIVKALKKHKIKASFFFSGDFIRKKTNQSKIKKLYKSGYLIGPATNHYDKLTDWKSNDISLISKETFLKDLKENYDALKKLGINKDEAPFFSPPFGLYTDSISAWCKSVGVNLIRSTPGTYSDADYTFPEMRESYVSSREILNKIIHIQQTSGLNGYILQFSFGSNPARKDKFYKKYLTDLIGQLQNAGYQFVDLYTALEVIDKPKRVENGARTRDLRNHNPTL